MDKHKEALTTGIVGGLIAAWCLLLGQYVINELFASITNKAYRILLMIICSAIIGIGYIVVFSLLDKSMTKEKQMENKNKEALLLDLQISKAYTFGSLSAILVIGFGGIAHYEKMSVIANLAILISFIAALITFSISLYKMNNTIISIKSLINGSKK